MPSNVVQSLMYFGFLGFSFLSFKFYVLTVLYSLSFNIEFLFRHLLKTAFSEKQTVKVL